MIVPKRDEPDSAGDEQKEDREQRSGAALTARALARRVRPAFLMAVGLVISAGGFVALAQVDGNSGLAIIVGSTIVFSLGLSPVFTLANDIIIGAAPPERAGVPPARSGTRKTATAIVVSTAVQRKVRPVRRLVMTPSALF